VRLVLRPEAVELGPAAGAPLTGVVRSCMFLGEKVEVVVACAGAALQVVRASTAGADNLREGVNVGIRFADGALTVLREEEA
jgi:hypothetical protein